MIPGLPYGEDAILSVDAGANNVEMIIDIPEKPKEERR